MPHIVILMFLV